MASDGTFRVVYLTGAPASGKSTLSEAIAAKFPEICLFTYSKELSRCISRKLGCEYDQVAMRRESARLIAPEAVAEVDQELVEFVAANRREKHVIIDSHAVTKEDWGFRVTPFSAPMLAKVAPDLIVTLFASPQITINRILEDPRGRPQPTVFEAESHTNLQASVAITYSILGGCPAYFLNSDLPTESLVKWFAERLAVEAMQKAT
jgi:adenylate kinase